MIKREQAVFVTLVLIVIVTICGVSLWLSRRDNKPRLLEEVQGTNTYTALPTAADVVDPLDVLAMYSTQTAVAMLHSPELLPFDDEGGVMGEMAMFGTQTAIVMNHTPEPTMTLSANHKYWSPPAVGDSFYPHFVYDASQWALTDLRTLASLRLNGCTLRMAGGRSLGPDWSTEEASLQVRNHVFMTILAKYGTVPQFVTYSLMESTVVFEIASASAFEQCREDGEVVLKTMIIP